MHHGPTTSVAQRGFTLIELMIVVAVVAVIALIALPNYSDSVRKSRRADAMAGLSRLQQLQERYRGESTGYAATAASVPGSWGWSSSSPEGHYDLSVNEASPIKYVMTATARAGSPQFADTKCRSLIVKMENGVVTTSSKNAAGDEDTTNANRCWVK
jgi:type IV pilus assembly protein PilE